MVVDSTEKMHDKIGSPLYEGDLILVSEYHSVELAAFLIKHFNPGGIYGLRMTPNYYHKQNSVKQRAIKLINKNKISCETAYSTYCWGHQWGFNHRCIKVTRKELNISEGVYKTLLQKLDLIPKEVKNTIKL